MANTALGAVISSVDGSSQGKADTHQARNRGDRDVRRILIVGGYLLTVLVVCMAVASSASAGEIGTCVKTKGGKYENKTCTATATEAKKAKYEWQPVTKPLRYVAHGGQQIFSARRSGEGEIRCGFSESTGEWINGTETLGEVVYTFCELRHNRAVDQASCEDLKSGLVKGKLIDHGETGLGGEEPADGEAWIQTSAGEGAPLFEFNCAPLSGKITGWLNDIVSPVNTALKEGKVGRKFKTSFNEARNPADGFVTVTFLSGEEAGESFGGSQEGEGLGEVALLAKESGYLKVKLEIRAG
jgi:hypothetical protein